jgi:predicted GH43/DUF377 family glycosyl hydrolase
MKTILQNVIYCAAKIHWETRHTFNPAAVVKDEQIFLLYRAEDDTGQRKIGGHTSRGGLAWSSDGIRFTTQPEPVLFPAEDNQQEHEWTGGCEDPRIAEGLVYYNDTWFLYYGCADTFVGVAMAMQTADAQ